MQKVMLHKHQWALVVHLACMLSVLGCAGEDLPGAAAVPTECQPGEWLREDGKCIPAGLPPDMQCQPGETPLDDGSCRPAGVVECAKGFEADGFGGCNAILPPRACPKGLMAVPGELRCREVAPCGEGDYGNIPVEANTQYVNAAYQGQNGVSNGSQQRPWTKIQQGIDAADYNEAKPPIVAVAAGSYLEDILIAGKPVKLWGRCPRQVEIVGSGNVATAAVFVYKEKAKQTEIHNIAVTGPYSGIGINGTEDVLLENLWIHDTAERGLQVANLDGPTVVSVKNSLVESTYQSGVLSSGATLTMESVVVRNTIPLADLGAGLHIQNSSSINLRASVIENNHRYGVGVFESDGSVEASVLRNTVGYGIYVDGDANTQGQVTISRSLVEHNRIFGVGIGGSAMFMDNTTVRGTQSEGTGGSGIFVSENSKRRGTATIRASLVMSNEHTGIGTKNSDILIDATIVRDTQTAPEGQATSGVAVLPGSAMGARSAAVIRGSVIQQNDTMGVLIRGSEADIQNTTVLDTLGRNAIGILVVNDLSTSERANAAIRTSVVRHNSNLGVGLQGADMTMEETVVEDTLIDMVTEGSGRGISIQSDPETGARANAVLRASLIQHNPEVGVYALGSDLLMDACIVRDSHDRGVDIAGSASNSTMRERSYATVRSCLIARNQIAGLVVRDSEATLEKMTVYDTRSGDDGQFGDGIGVQSSWTATTARIIDSRVDHSARANIASYGATVELRSTTSVCGNPDLNARTLNEYSFQIRDQGGNQCGCPEANHACELTEKALEPPKRVEPIDPPLP